MTGEKENEMSEYSEEYTKEITKVSETEWDYDEEVSYDEYSNFIVRLVVTKDGIAIGDNPACVIPWLEIDEARTQVESK